MQAMKLIPHYAKLDVYIDEYLSLNFKGTWTRLVKFVYIFFLHQILYISRMKPSLNRTTIFKLIVHGIELHATFEKKRK